MGPDNGRLASLFGINGTPLRDLPRYRAVIWYIVHTYLVLRIHTRGARSTDEVLRAHVLLRRGTVHHCYVVRLQFTFSAVAQGAYFIALLTHH